MSDVDDFVPDAVDADSRRRHRRKRHLRVSYFFFIAIAAVIFTKLDPNSLHYYSFGAMGLLALKMFGALFYRPAKADRDELLLLDNSWVTAVIPIYNEDPVMFEQGMRSLLAQSRLPNEIHIIDDCSADASGIRTAKKLRREFEARGVKYTVSVQPENKGKREALALGFQAAPYSDLFLCVDSDTVLSRDTVRELLLPMADEKIMASTGMVLALNHDSNIFTRLQDLRYGNSFLFERAAYSRLKAVLCCCGALSVYRGTLVRKYLPDFLNQQFLGKPAVFGDDRRMTNYCLMEGQVVFQETAVGYTAVPEKLPHFLRQQVRWNKSFFRESLWAFTHQKKYRPAFWLTCMELALWLVFGSAMFYSMVILPIMHPSRFVNHIGDYLVFMVLMGYLRNVRYLDFPRRGMGFIKRFGMFLLAPLYGVIQLLLLTPLRFYALLTLHKGSWGTRQGGVEVSVAGHEEELAAVWEEEDEYSSPQVSSTIEMMRLEGIALARTSPHLSARTPSGAPAYHDDYSQGELRDLGRNVPQQPVAWSNPPQAAPFHGRPTISPLQPVPPQGQYQQQQHPQQQQQQWQGQQWQGQGQGQEYGQNHGQVPYIPQQPQGPYQQQPQPQQPMQPQQQWSQQDDEAQQNDDWFHNGR
ncbi:glycosyltransferase family 2 protein [Streptomyces kunmingensis]|uniref:Glycosyltransferase family 2 protein n=1 Tax=Streptomyces kunmingensis TaxID=68225 RepID=A0ABU6C724_9ACTN|nr:glycosyltransferase [Streptomyces kunmingensis]MEB3960517.1 glycosyltransferase family 2 protein [Streptomyces kunmingensis]